MLVVSLLCGYTLYWMSDIPLKTALISGAAGGINEVIIFGMSVDANVAVIAFIQLFRIVIFLALIPYLSLISEKIAGKKTPTRIDAEKRTPLFRLSKNEYALLVICAMIGAWTGQWLRIPAGTMLGAMFASGLFAIVRNKTYGFDVRVRFAAQITLGLAMGQRVTPEIVGQLATLLWPAVVVTFVMLIGSTFLAILLYKTSDWDLTTCLLCASPAGLSQITTFAEELGVDSFTASVFHTVRIIGIVSLYPWIIMPLI